MSGKTNLKTYVLVAAFSLAIVSTAFAGRVIYLDADANGANNGSSWTDAYDHLQRALDVASYGDQIRVAAGMYHPVKRTDFWDFRTATFELINGVAIYGGFPSDGGTWEERAPNDPNNETILSADLAGNDIGVEDLRDLLTEPTRAENSYHVVTATLIDANTILDGFTITGGNANASHPHYCGGGMWNYRSSATLINCTFRSNSAIRRGGGIYNWYYCNLVVTVCTFSGNFASNAGAIANTWDSNPRITDCVFSRNLAAHYGAGIDNYNSSPIVTNCTFSENSATFGGGMNNNSNSHPIVTGCTFRNNSATVGGGMNNEGDTNLTNCTFSENLAYGGGGMANRETSATLTNCMFSKNSGIQFGGGMENWNSSPRVANCIFSGNSSESGGGMYNMRESSPRLDNCTFVGNSGRNGNGIACDYYMQGFPSTLELTNCILWDGGEEIWNNDGSTISVLYSDVKGGPNSVYDPCGAVIWGEGNIDADPCFADPGYWEDPCNTPDDPWDAIWIDGDYHLRSQAGRWYPDSGSWIKDEVTSPCIDAGDPASPIGYEPFPNGGIINMGAYGATAEASKSYFGEPVCETIVAGDINGDCKVNFSDFRLMAFHWLRDENR